MKLLKTFSIVLLNWKILYFIFVFIIFYSYVLIFDPSFPTSSQFNRYYDSTKLPIPTTFVYIIIGFIGTPLGMVVINSSIHHKSIKKSYFNIYDKIIILYNYIKTLNLKKQIPYQRDQNYNIISYQEKDYDDEDYNKIKTRFIAFMHELKLFLIGLHDSNELNYNSYSNYYSSFENYETKLLNDITDNYFKKKVVSKFRTVKDLSLKLENTDKSIMSSSLYVIFILGSFTSLTALIPIFLSIGSWVYGTLGSIITIIIFIGMLNAASDYQSCTSIFDNVKFNKRIDRKKKFFR
jgi:hypothetical protein